MIVRLFAACANAGLLIFVVVQLAKRGVPSSDEFWIVVLITVAPILSLVALLRNNDGSSWISLFLKRKAAEEKAKLADLEARLKR